MRISDLRVSVRGCGKSFCNRPAGPTAGLGQVWRFRARPATVRFYFNFRHLAALPRTAAGGQEAAYAVQQNCGLFDHLVGAQQE